MTDGLPQRLAGLCRAAAYPHAVGDIRVIETHISWVVLTGDLAYKLKKPVDLGFLNFSTLGLRRQACRMEVELNRRLAPSLYLDVVPVRDMDGDASLLDRGRVIDYAVRMRQFPQDAQLDRMLEDGKVDAAMMAALAHRIARFHAQAPVAGSDSPYGDPEDVTGHMQDNFPPARIDVDDRRAVVLDELERWTHGCAAVLSAQLDSRRSSGRVRECHGDLHLSNLVNLDDGVAAFDCIEFSDSLRWIDVMSEVAFLVMDLMSRRRSDLAFAFLNAYLESSGDYDGVTVLPLYLVYRSMVRAKVAGLMLAEQDAHSPGAQSSRQRRALHIDLAQRLSQPSCERHLILMHGLSGSGKSRLAQRLARRLGAIRIRSDVERKRLFGLPAGQRTDSQPDPDLYTPQVTAATYERLGHLARQILFAGFHVIVDAAFLTAGQRNAFVTVAGETGAVRTLIACRAAPEVLEQRVAKRAAHNRDASDATVDVLMSQRRRVESLDEVEKADTIELATDRHVDSARVVDIIRRRHREEAPPSLPDEPSSPDPTA